MKINILELPVFYINLKKEKQKDKETRELLEGVGFKNINRFDAILCDTKTEGCARSHQKILSEINVDGPFIVFEDDIEVNNGFNPIIDVPDNADAVYLGLSTFSLSNGRTNQDLIAEQVDDGMYRIYNMLAAHAILYLNKDYYSFISKAISAMLDAGRNQDNARAETMKYFNIYAPQTPLFYQGGKHRDVTRFSLDKVPTRPYSANAIRKTKTNKITKASYKLDQQMIDNPPTVSIVILSWQRPQNIKEILQSLSQQTYKNFSVHISNGNLGKQKRLQEYANLYRNVHGMKVSVGYDGNEMFAFRRLTVAKKLAESGTDIIMYIDDDVSIPNNYVEMCLSQYEPKIYGSGFAWSLFNSGDDYYKHRQRQWSNEYKLQYCGTGISIVDASIFLEDDLTNTQSIPHGAYKVEDLWLSYYAQARLNWKLKYIEMPGVNLGGGDRVALYRQIQQDEYDKADFLRDLVKMGWKIPKNIVKA